MRSGMCIGESKVDFDHFTVVLLCFNAGSMNWKWSPLNSNKRYFNLGFIYPLPTRWPNNIAPLIVFFTVPKFAISQSEAKSNVLISHDIKSLTWYPAISWSLSSKVMLPYHKIQRGFANKQTTRNLRFSWCFAVERRRKNLSRQN